MEPASQPQPTTFPSRDVLPGWHPGERPIVGNWQVSGITTFGSGTPVVITGPNDVHLPGVGGYANRLKSPLLPSDQQNLDRWFDITAFQPTTDNTGTYGSTGRNVLRQPDQVNTDFAIIKRTAITERIEQDPDTDVKNPPA